MMKNKENKKTKRTMNKLQNNQNKGITLIALVITIIVLLILAGVTIATLTGENGILTRATEASKRTEISSEEEAISLAYTGALAEKTGDSNILKDDLNDQFAKSNTNAEAVTDSRIHFTDTDRWYRIDNEGNVSGPYLSEAEIGNLLIEMFENAQADNCMGGSTCTQTDERKHIHVGDYVNFKDIINSELKEPNTSVASAADTGMSRTNYDGISDQTFTLSKDSNQLNWRVLGEENGKIKLIAGSPLKTNDTNHPHLYMYGANSYLTGPKVLDQICDELYGEFSYVDDARSVNMDDINEVTGITTAEEIKSVNLHPTYGGLQYGDTYTTSEYNQGYDWTPETWLENPTKGGSISVPIKGYYYSINDSEEPTVKMENTRAYNLLFNNVEYPNGAQYWLASRGVRAYPDYAFFGPGLVGTDGGITIAGTYGMFDSNGYEYGVWAAVRPVVVLESDVTLDDVEPIADQQDQIWE